MKILVTGANGYLGRGIVEELNKKGHQVIATDVSTSNIDTKDITKMDNNIFEISQPFKYFCAPDVVLHLAWRDGFIHNSDNHIIDLPKHFMFLKSMMEAGVKKVAVLGSMHEVGFFEGSIQEDTPCHPMSKYGIGKDSLRRMVQLLSIQTNIPYQWLRGFYIVSNSIHGSSIFSKIAIAEADGIYEFPFTSGQNQYDFLNYDEFCRQVVMAVSQDGVNGVINICSGKPEKLADRVERYIKENGFKIRLKYGAYPDRRYDSQAVWGNSEKINKIIQQNNAERCNNT